MHDVIMGWVSSLLAMFGVTGQKALPYMGPIWLAIRGFAVLLPVYVVYRVVRRPKRKVNVLQFGNIPDHMIRR